MTPEPHADTIAKAIAAAGKHLALPEVAGCYIITNTATGRVYVGQSVNVKRRAITHMTELKQGTHASKKMQSDYAEHGPDSFAFAVAIQCEEHELAAAEISLVKAAAGGDVYNTIVFNLETPAQRQARFRREQAARGLAEVRGILAPPEQHAEIRREASEMLKAPKPRGTP